MAKTENTQRVGIVSVCYRSMSVLPGMLVSVPEGTPVVLVDNSEERDDELRALAKKHNVILIENKENVGFGVACNQGAQALETEFVLFLNPDARLGEGALANLAEAADRHPDASAFSPRISNANGSPQFKRGSALLPRSQKMPRGWPKSERDLAVMSGAAIFVRKPAFDQVGGFDPNIFLYHEDDDLSLRLKQHCGPLKFVPTAMVAHAAGTSTARSVEIAALKAWHMGQSRVYAARKHKVPFARTKAIAAALFQVLSPAVVLSRRKRAKQMAFLKSVLHSSMQKSRAAEVKS